MKTLPDSVKPPPMHGALTLATFIFRLSPRRSVVAAILLVGGSLVEGLSIALLLPLFQLMGHNGHSTRMDIPTGAMAPLFGPTLSLELWVILSLYCGVIALVALFARFKAYYIASLFSEVINRIRVKLFRSIATARWSTVAGMRKADLDHALTGDIDRVQLTISSLYAICQIVVACIIYVILSAFLSLKMTLIAVVAGGLVFMLQRPIRTRAAIFGENLTKERRAQYRTISDFLGALKVAKSFNAEERYASGLADTLARLRRDTLEFVSFNANGTLIYQALSAAVACIFIYVSYAVYHVDFARILLLLFVFMRIAPRAAELQTQFQAVMTNLPAYDAMRHISDLCDKNHEPHDLTPALTPQLKENITFENVTFAYGETAVLKEISLSARAGQLTALTGPSGGGKSTIADLAMGLLIPDSGQILIDGTPLLPAGLRHWRSRTAYVPQETYLIAATLSENLLLAAPDASVEDLRYALRQARALEFADALPQGLETRVGDGGVSLSGGERQRISLARALLKKPSLLVLDEVTSALDRKNTLAILDTLTSLRGEMTILLITHDPEVHGRADHVIHVDKGIIADEMRPDAEPVTL